MADDASSPVPDPPKATRPEPIDFRWQAYFQKATEPVFLLNRHRRILFVNRAWEQLTGLGLDEVRGLPCRKGVWSPGDPPDQFVRIQCYPPPEVLKGQATRVRRLAHHGSTAGRWWQIDFLPLFADGEVVCILGRIQVSADLGPRGHRPGLPENLQALRDRALRRYALESLAGRTSASARLAEQVKLASRSRVPVLIVGEPGTGKQWVARTIHQQSLSCEEPFFALSCRHLSPGILSGIVFGEDGSGDFQTTSGSILLREPSHLPRDLQRLFQQQLNSAPDVHGPRLFVSISGNPEEEVRSGKLLEELYYDISTLSIRLPPLRERLADLPDLVERFLERLRPLINQPLRGLTDAAMEMLRAHSWPGNLSELYQVLRQAAERAGSETLDVQHFPAAFRVAVEAETAAPANVEQPLALDKVLEEVERRLIVLALRRAQGNKSRAAELLSIWRPRLLRRIEALGIVDPKQGDDS